MANDVTAFALEAVAAGGGPSAGAVAQALIVATASGDSRQQQRALVSLAAVCASSAARDAVAAGAVEAAVGALDVAPSQALRCLADCVRACPAAATKATRPHVLHAVLRAAQHCSADINVAYAATTLVAAVVAEEHVACYAVPLVVEEGALVLLHDALICANDASDFPLAIAALRASGDIAAHAHYATGGVDSVRSQMRDIGLISAANQVFTNMFASVLIRDAALAFITAVCRDSPMCATHFGELNGGDGIRLVLSAARRLIRTSAPPPIPPSSATLHSNAPANSRNSSGPTRAPTPQCPVDVSVSREHATELHRKTADALSQITLVERNCGVIRSLRGVSTIVSLVAHVAHSARHVEAALLSLDRCINNSQFAARDAYHAGAAAAIVVAMQRHRHRSSVQSCAIRCLIALTELYDCHRQAACRAFAVQAIYFALTEHVRSSEIVMLACKFMLLLSPCDIISNQICMADLLRVVFMRRIGNAGSAEVQTTATNLVEAIQAIPGDILRKVEAQVVHTYKVGARSSGSLVLAVANVSGSLGGSLGSNDPNSRRNMRAWRRRAHTMSTLRSSGWSSSKLSPASRLSFPGLSRSDNDLQAELRPGRATGRTGSNNTAENTVGELHYQVEDDLLAGIEKRSEAFLMRQTLGRTLESARRPDAECDDGISLDEAGLEESLSAGAAYAPDLTGGGLLTGTGSAPASVVAERVSPIPLQTAAGVGSSASSEPASPPWTQWSVMPLGVGDADSEQALSPLPTFAELPAAGRSDMPWLGAPQSFGVAGYGSGIELPQTIVNAPFGVSVPGSQAPLTLRRGETGSL